MTRKRKTNAKPKGQEISAEEGASAGRIRGIEVSHVWVNEFPDGEEGFSEPRIYEKRQVQVEAMRADGSPESNRAIIDWTRGSATPATMDTHPKRGECLSIATLEGAHWVDRGDFVIRGVAGEHYPCKPEIFEQTYIPAPVQEAPSPQDHVPLPAGPPLFGGDHALWIAFRATRSAVRGLIGEDAPQPDPEKLADQAVCMADFLRSAPDASDEAAEWSALADALEA